MADKDEPKILAFFCNYCSYAGADLAGTARMSYPPNMMIIRVLCTGRVDPAHVLEAFKRGADGVLVAGCHFGDCHFVSGNYKTSRKVALLKRMLEQLGVEPERLKFTTISSGEAERFVETVKEMTEDLRRLGPSPFSISECP